MKGGVSLSKIDELNAKTRKELDNYIQEVKIIVADAKDRQVTADDLEELGRQSFYAMDGVRTLVINYLKEL